MKFEEQARKAGFELAELKEAFIIEEITPYLEDNKLKQKLRIRLQEIEDYKQKVIDTINKLWVKYPATESHKGHNGCLLELKKELGLEK